MALSQHHRPCDVRRHQVRCELDPFEPERQGPGEAADDQGLGQPRNAGHQAMPPGEQGGHDQVQHFPLPHDHPADLI